MGTKPYSCAVKISEPLPNPTSSHWPSDTNGKTFSTILDETNRFCSIGPPTV